jgi:hypothetical protein
MPRQSQSSSSQIPGEDVLLDTLRNSKVTDAQRQQIWDAYHTQGDEKAFTGALNTLDIADDAKQTLYDIRYKGFKNQPTTPQAPSPTTQVSKGTGLSVSKGDVRPTAPEHVNATWDKIKGEYYPEALYTANKLLSTPLSKYIPGAKSFTDIYTDSDISKAPAGVSGTQDFLKLAARTGAGLGDFISSPTGIATVGLETLTAGAATPYLAAGFAASQAPETIEAAKRAYKSPTPENVQEALYGAGTNFFIASGATKGRVDPTMLSHREFVAGGPVLKPGTLKDLPKEIIPKTTTPMGPRDSAAQVPQIDFAVHAPEEAHAPQVTGFVGKSSPMRPFDPEGTRFHKGETIGMEPISKSWDPNLFVEGPKEVGTAQERLLSLADEQIKLAEEKGVAGKLMDTGTFHEVMGHEQAARRLLRATTSENFRQPLPETPAEAKASPGDLAKQAGLVYKGELMPGSGVHMFEDPIQPGQTMAAKEVELTSVDALKAKMDAKLAEFVAKPSSVKVPVIPLKPGYRPKSFDIPDQLRGNFDNIAELKRQADVAETDAQRDSIAQQQEKISAQSRGILKQHIGALNGEQLLQLRDKTKSEADQLDAQSKAISDLTDATVKNRGVKSEIADLRSTGGPVRQIVDPETGARITVKPDAKVTRGARSLLDVAQGRVPTSDFESLKVGAKPEGVSDEEWAGHVEKLQIERHDLKKKISDAVMIASETGSSLAEAGLEEHVDRLKEIEGLLGKYVEEAKPGRRANIPAELDELGAIKAPENLKSWTLERARLAFGKQLRMMPSDEEFYQEAGVRQEKARLLRTVSDVSDKVLQARKKVGKGEKGFIGEGVVSPPSVSPVSDIKPEDVTPDKVLRRAQQLDRNGWRVTDDKPSSYAGWLSPDGKVFIDKGSLSHEDVATELLPEHKNAQVGLLQSGWIRKVNPRAFEIGKFTREVVHSIEMDTIRGAVAGKDLLIDMPGPRGLRSMHIDAGWENLTDAIERARKDPFFRNQSGKIGGIAPLTGIAVGGMSGAAAGAHLAGVPGAIVGGTVGMVTGFITPAILKSRPMLVSMRIMAPIVRGAGQSLKQFLVGEPQMDVGTPDMKQILNEQLAHATKSTDWIERAKRMPAQVYKGFDPFAYVADKRNMGMVGRVLMSFDKDGKVFRDLTVPDTQSLYVALRNAGGEALGQRAYQGFQYSDIKSDAAKAGLRPALDVYLNLKGYERVHEVLAEHSQDLAQSVQQIQQNLQNPSNSLRQIASMQDSLKEAQSMQRAIHRKVQSGEATPNGYTPSKIQQEYANLQQQLGDEKFRQVGELADRTFKSRAHILDMLHSNGLVSLEDYLTYSRRGPEYVPMERIMDDLANNQFTSSAKPLHLRHQSVIQGLEGSSRTNVNPWEAFDHADRKAFNQIYRNDAMTQALDLAKAYPTSIGLEFKPVGADYRAKVNEGILGHYEDGKPNLYAVPKYLADTMQNLPAATKTALGVAANWYGHQFKKAATIGNIGFQVSSLISHAISSAVLPESGLSLKPKLPVEAARFINGWARSVKDVLTKSQNYREMVRSGGAFGTFQRMLDPEYFANPSELGFAGKLAKGRILDAAQDLAAGLEDINRVNTFTRARESGLNERAAGWQTKQYGGAPDFSRLGDLSQPVNQAMMFFNAANQYLHQATSAIQKDPMRVGGLMIAMTASMIALNSWNAQQKDSKGNDLLRKESILDRQRNWVVLTPWTYTTSNGAEKAITMKVPKPKIAQLLNPIEDLINYATGKEDRTGTQQALDSISNVSPIHLRLKEGQVGKTFMQSVVSSVHPIIKTGIEQYANLNDYGQPIVPANQQNIQSRYQVGPTTTPIAQQIGQGGVKGAVAGGALGATLGTTFGGWTGGAIGGAGGAIVGATGPSPRRTDAAIQSMTAGGGAMAEGYLNPFFGAVGSTKQMEGPERVQNIPVAGLIAKRFTTNPMDAQEQALLDRFYSTAQQLQEPMTTLKFLEKNHPDQIENFLQTNKDQLWQAQMAQEMQSRLNEVIQAQHTIESAQGLAEDKRVQVLKNIHSVKVQILKTFTGVLDKPRSAQSGAGQGNAR